MNKISFIAASGGMTRPIIANIIEHSMDSTPTVVMSQMSKFMRQRSNFQYAPTELKFDMDGP